MYKLANTLLTLILAVSLSMAYADDRHHPDKGEQGAKPAMSQGMGMMDMGHMQDMQQKMNRIHRTEDPVERQRLMQEHMDEMHKMMGDMHSMMGQSCSGGLMGSDPKGDMSIAQCQEVMGKRMDMMQGMQEQMLEQMRMKKSYEQCETKQ